VTNVRATIPILVLLAAATACSTSGGFERQTIEGGPGQPIMVELVGASMPLGSSNNLSVDQPVSIQLEISNDSDRDVTVTSITVQQHSAGSIQIYSANIKPNDTIAPAKDKSEEIRTSGRQLRPLQRGESAEIVIRVTVEIDHSDTYVYYFEVPLDVPR
jgi:hypothetical protein